jgi:hypothetical protein
MSLKDELINLTKPIASAGPASKGRCGVGEWLKTQDEQLVEEFKELLDTQTSTLELHRFLVLKFPDLPFRVTTFRSHRNHWCSCL